jgi:hypothetical protein
MRKAILTPIAASVIGIGMLAAPLAAHADSAPPTVTSFGLTAGYLVLNTPDAATLTANHAVVGVASVATGTISGVGVVDNLGDNAGWTVNVASTDFTAASGGAIVAAHLASYASGDITGASGDATAPTFTRVDTVVFPSAAGTPMTAASAGTDGTGSNAATWVPTITVPLPAYGQNAGTYSGTITLSLLLGS